MGQELYRGCASPRALTWAPASARGPSYLLSADPASTSPFSSLLFLCVGTARAVTLLASPNDTRHVTGRSILLGTVLFCSCGGAYKFHYLHARGLDVVPGIDAIRACVFDFTDFLMVRCRRWGGGGTSGAHAGLTDHPWRAPQLGQRSREAVRYEQAYMSEEESLNAAGGARSAYNVRRDSAPGTSSSGEVAANRCGLTRGPPPRPRARGTQANTLLDDDDVLVGKNGGDYGTA